MDLYAAEHLSTLYPTPYEIICFHCQQAVEKYLKGFLCLHNEEPPYIHDLLKLRGFCEQYDTIFSEITEYCKILTLYGVQPRYSRSLQIDKDEMLRALRGAQAVKEFMRQTAPSLFQQFTP
jgi:HEPN domain-containing protein